MTKMPLTAPEISQKLLDLYQNLSKNLDLLPHPPDLLVYNPLEYAWSAFSIYVERYLTLSAACPGGAVLLLGMNPGPHGMAQTGIPFGDVPSVRDWMHIQTSIGQPAVMHHKKPVNGFLHRPVEVSGKRLWGFFSQKFPDANDFFARYAVVNFNPLLYLAPSGANFAANKLPKEQARPVEKLCAAALQSLIEIIRPRALVGVGGFAHKQLLPLAERCGLPEPLCLSHPSPANPQANRGWHLVAQEFFSRHGLWDHSPA